MSGQKKKKSQNKPARKSPAAFSDQLQTGMPARDNIRKVVDAVSPQGASFKILKTTEADAYDKVPQRKKKQLRKS